MFHFLVREVRAGVLVLFKAGEVYAHISHTQTKKKVVQFIAVWKKKKKNALQCFIGA